MKMDFDDIGWDDEFMTMAYLVSMKSKDRRTRIGAVVIGPSKEIRSTGYNGFVRRLNDSVPERHESPEKHYWFEHAERNAIYNATLMGVSLIDCIMYTNGIPCMDCSRGVVQSGIKEVVVDKRWDLENSPKWREHNKRALEMFAEVGVNLRYYDGNFVEIIKMKDGSVFPLK
jgi:dCMP deaminase